MMIISTPKPAKPPKPAIVTYETNDLFNGPETVILHGCNAQGVMGSGVARQVRTLYPEAYDAYMKAYADRADKTRGLPLGSFSMATSNGKTIINGVTQNYFGRDPGIVYVSYAAISDLLNALAEVPAMIGRRIALPRIGAGLANGDWNVINGILQEDRGLLFTVYTPPTPIAP